MTAHICDTHNEFSASVQGAGLGSFRNIEQVNLSIVTACRYILRGGGKEGGKGGRGEGGKGGRGEGGGGRGGGNISLIEICIHMCIVKV